MPTKKPRKKLNENTQMLLLLTVVVTFVGLTFGKMLDGFLMPSDEVAQGADNDTTVVNDETESEDSAEVKTDENVADTIYVVQLGVYSTYDNVLDLASKIQTMGFNYGVSKVDGKYVVYSHVVGDRSELSSVEEALKKEDVNYFVKSVVPAKDDLKWQYYLSAVKQIPYEMTAEFIQTFSNDDFYIFGYYTTLSNSSFDPLSNERQKMLLEIYQWLIE
ncbi:MAG TPA: sporulation protein [Firmicutes bacterium]|nr:sporulation protein [Bacillota bacterium]